ncbi:MAG: rRNA cytosine-C5-methyltransferase [Bacteroidales bacterium]|nr:rRNA cytosine-C5-methyltransferase [Bacteroidales bacterium]
MNLPIEFVNRTKELLSEQFSAFEASLQEDPPVSVRLNHHKTEISLPLEKVPWCETGYYLQERSNFTFDPLFHAGLYYVQEASSMFLEQAVKQWVIEPKCVLDLCAAPGGKSTHLRSLLSDDCLLVSNEVIRNRAHILTENIIKWGNPNCVVTQNQARELGNLTHFFDAIIVDAPCSGEGMFRKDPTSMNEWSVHNVNQCAIRQQDIIADIWDALKPGGILIYSTCTYNLEENESNIKYFIEKYDAEVLKIEVRDEWNIHSEIKGDFATNRFFPHLVKGEGFFMAVLRKSENETRKFLKLSKNKSKKEIVKTPEIVKKWIFDNRNFSFEVENNSIIAIPKAFESEMNLINLHGNILHKGISIAETKGKDLIPNHNLALSIQLDKSQFATTEVDYSTAISFLRCEALQLNELLPKGYTLIQYEGHPLGWVKNIGSRANNLYPNEWRIRSSYLPENLKTFWGKSK